MDACSRPFAEKSFSAASKILVCFDSKGISFFFRPERVLRKAKHSLD